MNTTKNKWINRPIGVALLLVWGVSMESDGAVIEEELINGFPAVSNGVWFPPHPPAVEELKAVPGDRQVLLQWEIPEINHLTGMPTEFDGVKVVRQVSGSEEKTVVYDGIYVETEYLDINLTNGVIYHYGVNIYKDRYLIIPLTGPPHGKGKINSPWRTVSAVPQAVASSMESDGAVIEVEGTNCFVVSWLPTPGQLHTVQRADGLIGGFFAITNLMYPVNSYTDVVHEAADRAFYRVEARSIESE